MAQLQRCAFLSQIAGDGMTEFGQLLKTLRERRGVSQSKLAERAEFDHSYVSRLEGGARMPTRDAVDRLGLAMELSDGERDVLLAAAGFLPRDFARILSNEPVLGEVFYLLSDEQVPSEYRENMRQVLHLLAEQARLALKSQPNQGRVSPVAA
jgi:transcriptional regulator with XRE-family HTH domain